MNTKRFLCAALGAVCYFAFLQAQVRTEQTFEKGWKFTREDNAEFALGMHLSYQSKRNFVN